MKNPLSIFILVLLFLWILLGSFLFSKNCNCGAAAAAVPAVIAPVEKEKTISIEIEDNDRMFKSETTDNLLFPLHSCDYITPLSDRLLGVFNEAANHLQNNSDRILILTGIGLNTENNECQTSGVLGMGRAEKVKALLVEKGAPADQIRTSADIQSITLHNDHVLGGVRYEFISGNVSDVEDRLRMGNITLYFDTNEKNISLSREQQKYFEDLKYFLAQKQSAQIAISGHTDNTGDETYNKSLSRRRARSVRDYLSNNGIPMKNMKNVIGMGSDQPIASNDTEEGKAKNRRVEVTIK